MDWVIYVLGDLALTEAVLNGVAMVFNADSFRGSGGFGGGAIFLMMLLSLVGVIFWALKDQWRTVNPSVMLILFIVWMSAGFTRATVILEDVSTGSARAVDNVPLLVAVPASIVTTAAVKIGELFQTAYSTTGGTVPLTDQGFANPLKLMLSLRNTVAFAPDLVVTYSNFSERCVARYMPNFLSDPNGVLNSFKTATPPSEWVWMRAPYYNRTSAVPAGMMLTCAEVAERLAVDFEQYMGGPVNKQIGAAMGVSRPDGAAFGFDQLEDAWLRMSATAAADVQSAAALLALGQAANNGLRCGVLQTTDLSSYLQCVQALHDQAERFNIDAASAGAGFTRTMSNSMSFLLALFIGLSPLVMLVALASGPKALDLLGKYVMFGVWTQSWLPAAYLLNFFVLFKWNEAISRLMTEHGGLTLSALPGWYEQTAKQIAIASDLMAATPLITLAVLTGSYFALAKFADRMSGRDHSDERQLQPAPTAVGANVAVAPQRIGTGAVGFSAEGIAATKISFSDSNDQTLASRASKLEESSAAVARMTGEGTSFARSWEAAKQNLSSSGFRGAREVAETMNYVDSLSRTLQEKHGLSKEVGDRIQGVAKAGVALGGSGLAMSGDFTGAGKEGHDWIAGTDQGRAWKTEFAQRVGSAAFRENADSDATRQAFNLSSTERDELQRTLSTAEKSGKSYERAAALSRSGKLDYSGDYNQTHQRASGAGLAQELVALHANLINTDAGYTSGFSDHSRRATFPAGMGGEARDFNDVQLGVIVAALQSAGHHETVTDIGSRMAGLPAGGLHGLGARDHADLSMDVEARAQQATSEAPQFSPEAAQLQAEVAGRIAQGASPVAVPTQAPPPPGKMRAEVLDRDVAPVSETPPADLGPGNLATQEMRERVTLGTVENAQNTAATAGVATGYVGHKTMQAVKDAGNELFGIGRNTIPNEAPPAGYQQRVDAIPR